MALPPGRSPALGQSGRGHRTIDVTDIPASDPIPRKRLRDHLLSEDFFFVARYPNSRLRIDSTARENDRTVRVNGTLTMRGQSHPVSFFAHAIRPSQGRPLEATALLTVDRHKWGVRYRGSSIKDDLVDDDFTLDVVIVATPGPGS